MRFRFVFSTFPLLALVAVTSVITAAPASGQEATEEQDAAATEESNQMSGDPSELIKQGSEMLQKGEYVEALKHFDELVGSINRSGDPALYQFLPFAHTGRGHALAALNEDEAAMEEFQNVINEQSDFADALIGRGQLYLKLNRAEEAFIDFQNAVKAQRSNPAAQFGYGKASVLLGGMEQAIKPLSRVIGADEKNAEAFQLRGRALNGLFKTPEAIADLDQSLSLNPEDHETYFWLAVVRLRTKEYQEAVNQFIKAIEHYKPKPGQEGPYLEGHYALASSYVELGKTEKDDAAKKAAYQASIDVCEKLLGQLDKDNPNYDSARAAAIYSRGVAERMLGEFKKAIESFSEAIKLNPDLGDAYFRRGICLHMIGEDKMAIADFVQAANLNPYDDPRSNIWEGFTYAKLGDYYEALRAYGNAIAASDRYTPAYVNRGLAYMALGEYEKAIRDFNDAIRLEPTTAEHYFKRGLAYERLGDNEKAVDSFTSALKFDPRHAGARRHLQSLGGTIAATR